LSSNAAILSGNFKSANLATNLVSSTGVTIGMAEDVGGSIGGAGGSGMGDPPVSTYDMSASSAAVFASNIIGPSFRGSNLGGGGSSSNVVFEPTYFCSNLTVAGVLTATSNVHLTGMLSASNVDVVGKLTASNIALTGSLKLNGMPLVKVGQSSYQLSEFISSSTVGTESAPIAGGNLVLDTSSTLSAIVELASSSEPLGIALGPSFAASQVGKSGNIVIIERSTTGRALTLDPRVHFATDYNLTASSFTSTSLDSTTLASNGIVTTAAPALGGFAVDTIEYCIPKTGFALGNYYRQFKCMPPMFDEAGLTGTTHAAYTNATAFTLDVAGFLIPTYNQYYGPLRFSVPSVVGVSISPSSGILTIAKNTAFVGPLVVSIQGVAGTTMRTLALDVKPWYAPVILDVAPGLPASQNTGTAAYTTPAPTMEHGPDYTGAVTWSHSPVIAGATLDSTTGQLTFTQDTVYSGTVTLTATGPAPSAYTTSASVILNVVNWVTPSIDPIASQVGTTAAAPT
jgi:hypothetical protein